MAIVIPILSTWDPSGVRKATASLDQIKGGWGKAGAVIEKGMLPAAGALGGLGTLAQQSITAAGDLARAQLKTNTVFGAGSKDIQTWASNAEEAFGLSSQGALEAAANSGAYWKAMGKSAAETEKLSTSTVETAAALAQYNGLGVDQTLDMISGALRGEYDSLQTLIPTISAASVEQKALALTHKKSAKDLTDSEKAAAAYQLILEGSKPATDAMGKSMDTAAGKQATFSANVQTLAADIGTSLLPLFEKMVEWGGKIVAWAQENSDLVLKLAGAVGGLAVAVLTINAAMKVWRAIQAVAIALQWAWNTAMAANPIGLIVLAIVALVAIFAVLWVKSEGFRNFFIGLWEKIKGIVSAVVEWFKTALPAAWDAVKNAFVTAWNAIKDALSAVWNGLVAAAKAVFNGVKDFILGVWNGIKAAAQTVWNAIKSAIEAVWNGIKTVVTTYINIVKTVVSTVFNAVKTTVTTIWDGIKGAIKTVWDFIKRIFDGARTAVQPFIDAFLKIKDKITGFMETIREKIQGMWDKVKGILDSVGGALSKIPFVGKFFKGLSIEETVSFLPGAEVVPTRKSQERPVVINISGAVDQEGTARTLSALLDNYDLRHARVPVGRAVAW